MFYSKVFKKYDLSVSFVLQLWLFAPYLPLFYIMVFSVNTADSLGQGVCKYVGENLYLFVCGALYTQAHTKHTPTCVSV